MRAVIVADSGPVMARLTQLLAGIDRVQLVRHASGRTNVESQMRSFAPELVVIDDMTVPPRALVRVAEIRRSAPDAAIVVMADRIESPWLGEALRLGAAAVLPAGADQATFRDVIADVLEPASGTVIDFPRLAPRRVLTLETHPEGSAA
jgi:DNA-binding NarL/FixJ family response regulator